MNTNFQKPQCNDVISLTFRGPLEKRRREERVQ